MSSMSVTSQGGRTIVEMDGQSYVFVVSGDLDVSDDTLRVGAYTVIENGRLTSWGKLLQRS